MRALRTGSQILLRPIARASTSWVMGVALTLAVLVALVMVSGTSSAAAAGDIPEIGEISPKDVLATVSTARRSYSKLLMLPLGENPGVLWERERRHGSATISLVRPGKAPKELWSGEDDRISVRCAADASGFILAEYDKVRPNQRPILDQRFISVKVFNAAGKKTHEYVPERKVYLLAALSEGAGLFVERGRDGRSNFLLHDKTGKLVCDAGPFKAMASGGAIAWSIDGSRLLVNRGDQLVGRGGGDLGLHGFGRPSTKILVVDMRDGKVLHELPPARRLQLSPDGNLVVTSGDGKLRFWKDGKEVKVFDLPTPATLVVFSPDGRYVGFPVADEVHVYRTDDWTRTMAVKSPEEGQRFGLHGGTISNTGRMIVTTHVPQARVGNNHTTLLCLYSSKGVRLWMWRNPRKNGIPTLKRPRLTPDGKEAYLHIHGKVVRVTTPLE